jgi:vacuolar-type H+-ATPase subunit D/Vma8
MPSIIRAANLDTSWTVVNFLGGKTIPEIKHKINFIKICLPLKILTWI